jgi:hypothetical protein
LNPINDEFEIALNAATGPLSAPVNLDIYYKKENNNATPMTLKVRLMQGATEIASWTYTGISSTFFERQETLTAPQIAAITDWSELRLKGIANPITNLIVNPDFSSGITGWNGVVYNNSEEVVDDTAISVVSGWGRATAVGPAQQYAGLVQAISVSNGATYNISVDYRSSADQAFVRVSSSQFYIGEGNVVLNSNNLSGAGTYTSSFVANATTVYLRLFVNTSGGQYAEFVNVLVAPD